MGINYKNAKEIQFSFELKQKKDTKEYTELNQPSSYIAGLEVGELNSSTEEYNYSSIYESWSWSQKIIQALIICRKVYSVFRLNGR